MKILLTSKKPQLSLMKVNELIGFVAGTVNEQSLATQEIAEYIAQASLGLQEVNGNGNQSSSVTGEIIHDIAVVDSSATSPTKNRPVKGKC